jgi:drug/metabolite transporter (DMT)-like permease
MRWINGVTLLLSGLLFVFIGYDKFGDSRFSGLALLWGAAQILGAGVVVIRGEVNPDRKIPKIVANSWAAAFWYSAIVIVALKYVTLIAGSETPNTPHEVSSVVLAAFISHAVLLTICPLCYVWSQFHSGRNR